MNHSTTITDIFTSEYTGVSSFFAVFTMRSVVRDEEDDGVFQDVVFLQLVNDVFNSIMHLQEVVSVSTLRESKM